MKIDRAVLEVRAVFRATGDSESRFWFMDECLPSIEPQEWMIEPRKSWVHPQDPIVCSFLVDTTNYVQAMEWLNALGGSKKSLR